MSSSTRGSTPTIRLPRVSLPRIPSGSRNPRGWSTRITNLRTRGLRQALQLRAVEPAGIPPANWTGTKPEWAIYWGLLKNNLRPGLDFEYQAYVPGVGSSYYSTIDFLIRDYNIGIEVQGKYWHYGQGSDKIFKDMFRANAFAGQGIKIIFIDESDAVADPQFYVKDALLGIDHSQQTTGRLT